MRVGSLFTGIGGLDLGLERAGFEIAWQVEIDPYCQQLLGERWPEVKRHRDIRECGKHNLEAVDLVVGGFPCQDISSAGKQAGIEGERSGLWKEQARIIEEIRPSYVLIENVAALLYANKTCNGERREAAITTVLRDLAAIGYDAEWRVCSAAEFGAPHLRKRVFIVAYLPGLGSGAWRAESARLIRKAHINSTGAAQVEHTPGPGREEWLQSTRIHAELNASSAKVAHASSQRRQQITGGPHGDESQDARRATPYDHQPASHGESSRSGHVADATSARRTGRGDTRRAEPPGETLIHDTQHSGEVLAHPSDTRLQERIRDAGARTDQRRSANNGDEGDAESCLGGVFNGFSYWLDSIEQRWPARPGEEQFEWEPPRVITGKLPNRVARLKGLGNAALPQIAEATGKRLYRG